MVGSGVVQKAGGKMGSWDQIDPHLPIGNEDPILVVIDAQTARGIKRQLCCQNTQSEIFAGPAGGEEFLGR